MERTEILGQIQPTYIALCEVIDALTDNFNRPPSYGGWTPGQVARHLQMSQAKLIQALEATSYETRHPENAKVAAIIGLFLNFDSKYDAPGFITPEDQEFDANRLRNFFSQLKNELSEKVPDLALDVVVPHFDFPHIGTLTRLEMIAFALFHTQRHIRQMEKMIADFNASTF